MFCRSIQYVGVFDEPYGEEDRRSYCERKVREERVQRRENEETLAEHWQIVITLEQRVIASQAELDHLCPARGVPHEHPSRR